MTSEREYRDTQYSRMLLVLGSFIAFGTGIAVGAVFGPGSRWGVWLLGLIAVSVALHRTRLLLRIDAAGVHVNAACLPWSAAERLEVLEGEAMRRAVSTEAHPRDFLRLRSTTAGVRVWLNDASDPHRAWVVSVRHPTALRATLQRLDPLGASRAE